MDQFNNTHQEEEIDIKALFVKFLHHWHLFALTIVIALIIAFLYNKYTLPIYQVSTTVLIEENKSNLDPQKLIGFGIMSDKKNLKNEIGILKSYSLAYRTIQKLNFYVSYFHTDGFITKELYQNSPIIVEFNEDYPQLVRTKFKIEILSNTQYKIQFEEDEQWTYLFSKHEFIHKHLNVEYSKIHNFGETISHPLFKLKVTINPEYFSILDEYNDLFFTLNDIDYLIDIYSAFDIEPINREVSIVSLTLKGSNIQKSVNFLNQLTQEYLNRDLEKKNEVAINTIKFISTELQGIADSLTITENNLQDFRTTNQIMDVDFQAQQVFEYMKNLENKKAVLLVKSKYYKNLKEYLLKKNSVEDIVVPSSIGIEDPLLNTLVAELTRLFNTRSELLFSSTKKNPMVLSLEQQIKNTKNALIENINSIVSTSDIAINDVNERIRKLSQQINHLPKTQRQLFSIERKFKLNDAIYTYLLQKLSEAQITKASNRPDNEIIDCAKISQYSKVHPKGKSNYMIAFIIGCIIPIIYVFGKDYLNDKIIERKDVENLTKLPIVGHVLHNNKETELVVAKAPKSAIAESFRSIRTNIQYLAKGKEKQVIMVTSNMTSAGKTFISMNLASIFAQYEKKTVLLGFDLRKPKIYDDFKLSSSVGLSTYYINNFSVKEIIQKSSIDNLDIIIAGPIPPNPAELIASTKTKKLFEELLKIYDYIILDTPPLGLVTDAFLLMEYVDVNLFIVRQHHTVKKLFESIIKDIEQKGFPNFGILINDVKLQKNSYGYGYGYGYGQGYYTDDKEDEKKSLLKSLKNIL
jgi:capsular exopolysaccharide synthesis family protein